MCTTWFSLRGLRQKYRICLRVHMRGFIVRIVLYYGPVYYFGLYRVLLIWVPYSFWFFYKQNFSAAFKFQLQRF